MRKLLVALVVVFVGSIDAIGAPSRKDALAAIATLESNLLSDAAVDASRVITQFAQESEEVTFTLGPETVPWVLEKRVPNDSDDAVYAMLFAVYFAGNAKSQLVAGKAEDDPYSGWTAAIRAYRQIQTKKKIVIPSLEKLSEMEAKGVLKTHAQETKAREKKPNQSLEPTPTAGTSAAEQPLVPAAVVAHL